VTNRAAPPAPSDDRAFFGHPRGLGLLFATEMWERFSFYGLRPLLVLFMAAALSDGGFGFERTQASAIVGIYAASVYLASLPGGWIADRWLGLRRSILTGAVLITSGHLAIGISGMAGAAVGKTFFFLGLVLIVFGTGLLKPNISALVGDLYPDGGARRDAGFSVFYMGINSGALIGQLVTGYLGERVSWHWGFGAAGFGMLLGLLGFWLKSKAMLGTLGEDIVRDPDPVVQARREATVRNSTFGGLGVIALVFALASAGIITLNPLAIGSAMTVVLVGIAVAFFAYLFAAGGLTRDEKARSVVIFLLFIFAAVFWAAFEQAPTSLQLFAKDFTDLKMLGMEIPATWFQSVNSLFIIGFSPVFGALWLWLSKRGLDLSSPTKFMLGLLFAALGFQIMVVAANQVLASGGTVKVSPWFLTCSYLFQTFGELCLSPVGLSSMTKLAPRRYVGQMMGIWFLATSVGNLVAGLVGGHVDPTKLEQTPLVFSGTAIALAVAAAVIGLLIVPVRRMMAGVR
jgi:POT family proton-dependent oligopeptide transporter